MTGERRIRWIQEQDDEKHDSTYSEAPPTPYNRSRQQQEQPTFNANLEITRHNNIKGSHELNNNNNSNNNDNNHRQQNGQLEQQQQQPWPYNMPINSGPNHYRNRDIDDYEDDNTDEENDSANDLDDENEMAFNHLYRNQSLAPPEIKHERLEWQQMLQSVLLGEVLKSEKKRLSTTDRLKQQKPMQEIWMSLRALLRGRTIAQEQKYLEEGRKEINSVIDDVMAFKVKEPTEEEKLQEEKELAQQQQQQQGKQEQEQSKEGSGDSETPLPKKKKKNDALDQVAEVLKKVDRIESLYSTRAEMINANPRYGQPDFQARLDALNAWCTITRSLYMQYKILRDWTGSKDLQIAPKEETVPSSATTTSIEDKRASDVFNLQVQRTDPSFVERILKESALQDTFDKRTLSALNLLLVKSKRTMIANNSLFREMKLPPFIHQLRQLAVFPTSLVEEALKLRLEYKDRLHEPPKQMVDAMMEDYRGLLALACRVKKQYQELAHPAPGWQLKGNEFIDRDYDVVLMDSMRFYFKLITWKLDLERENSLRECEVMEKEWDFLKGTVCQVVIQADEECASQFCQLTNRLLQDVMQDYISNLKIPSEGEIEAKYTKVLHGMRMRARKLLQFARFFTAQFENAAEYVVDSNSLEKLVTCLVDTGHFLVYTGSFEEERIYIIASPSMYGREDAIRRLIRTCFAGDRDAPSTPGTPGTPGSTHEQCEDYVLVLTPWQSIVWDGEVAEIPTPMINLGTKPKRVRLVTGDAHSLHSVKAQFWRTVQSSGIEILQEHRAHIPRINRELYKIKMTVFKLADSTITSVGTIRDQTRDLSCQELVEECFSFASDFGMRAARFLELAVRLQLDLKLVRLAIDWICFITDDCVPSDRKTFRWAVAALEFGHLMTRGVNILALNEAEFSKLQSKVARCIALLISHFDVLGTRWTHELQLKEEQQRLRGVTAKRNQYMTSNNKRDMDKDNITTSSTFGATSDTVSASGGVTYIRDVWMRKIRELENTRNLEEQERKIVGKILDDQKPEDQSLMFLAPSSSNISFRWQQGRFIGAGTFGSVYLAINLDTSSVMAVKEIRFPDSNSLSALHKAIKEEMKVMEMLNHPNIVQYFGMEVHRDKVYIFMEYCENGSLGSLLDHGGRIEDEVYIVKYAYELLSGLKYLHGNNIVHRDIKPDNILIDYQGQLKLSDFGAAKILAKGQKTMGRTTMNMNVNSLAGTPMYMAPEVITGGDTGRKGSMDIWSLGCCIVQMATGRRPWSTLENEWSVMYHVVTGHPPLPDASQLSSDGIDFLKKCFTRNPMKRPTANELLSHRWIVHYLENYYQEDMMEQNGEYEYEYDYAAAGGSASISAGGGGGMQSFNNGSAVAGGVMTPGTDYFDSDHHPQHSSHHSNSNLPHHPEPSNPRSIGSIHSFERPLVRSIPNSLAIEGIANSHINGEQAQAYFRDIAARNATNFGSDGHDSRPGSPSMSRNNSAANSQRSVMSNSIMDAIARASEEVEERERQQRDDDDDDDYQHYNYHRQHDDVESR
ncbi:hypothetical protein BDA99DRAFT_526957 [Phascolomyces articulosus]|uniref:Protein kinase domain-containing protein n=1 Tax=Phascolomyces articulosus TaxID=60185 RepID=A0AAD5P851_9FUNG|nr:hypothetical protein BDA99DRAFT_526957 [Phascolomyces articulosus]